MRFGLATSTAAAWMVGSASINASSAPSKAPASGNGAGLGKALAARNKPVASARAGQVRVLTMNEFKGRGRTVPGGAATGERRRGDHRHQVTVRKVTTTRRNRQRSTMSCFMDFFGFSWCARNFFIFNLYV